MARTNSASNINCRPVNKNKTPCCPDCGALECLCRPRFFAGQLLSEQDLNRLDKYIKNKNRLHNRHQHGWGVVNGLMVLCDPCGEVKVTQGYAIDPCGDDIVVCEETTVNICELIRNCKQQDKQPACEPVSHSPPSDCSDIEEEWVLTIKYEEWASRGVTALRGNVCPPKSCSTGCNDEKSAGRTGGRNGDTQSSFNNQSTGRVKNRAAPAECEATVTCEGFSFDAYKKPETESDKDDDRILNLDGAFWKNFNCCAEPLMATVPPMPDLNNKKQLEIRISRWCCLFRDNLLKYYLTHPNASCEIVDFIRTINCPNINNTNTFAHDFFRSFLQLIAAWAEGIKNCICLSLLPPTPEVNCDLRVPLATVRIRVKDCKVLRICNWTTERKMMLTWPAMSYWLGILSIGEMIRDLLDRFCCNTWLTMFDQILKTIDVDTLDSATPVGDFTTTDQPHGVNFAQAMHLASGSLFSQIDLGEGKKNRAISILIDSMVARQEQPLELGALLNSVSSRFKVPDNDQGLNNIEAKNLPLVLMSEILIKPVLTSFMSEREAEIYVKKYQEEDLAKKHVSPKEKEAEAKSTDGMQQQLDEMLIRIEEQNKKIEVLHKTLNK